MLGSISFFTMVQSFNLWGTRFRRIVFKYPLARQPLDLVSTFDLDAFLQLQQRQCCGNFCNRCHVTETFATKLKL